MGQWQEAGCVMEQLRRAWANIQRTMGGLGPTHKLLFGSLAVIALMTLFLVSQYADIGVFHLIKRLTHNRFLWLRATGSTAVSQLIDTCVIQTLAWVGTPVQSKIPNIILTSYAFKLLVALALTPLIYAGHSLVERGLKIDPVVLGPDGEPVAKL